MCVDGIGVGVCVCGGQGGGKRVRGGSGGRGRGEGEGWREGIGKERGGERCDVSGFFFRFQFFVEAVIQEASL